MEKPVSLTYVGLATARGVISRCFQWEGNRTENKENSVRTAIEMILSALGQGG